MWMIKYAWHDKRNGVRSAGTGPCYVETWSKGHVYFSDAKDALCWRDHSKALSRLDDFKKAIDFSSDHYTLAWRAR